MLLNFLQEKTIGNHDDLPSQDRVVMIFLNSYFHIQHLKKCIFRFDYESERVIHFFGKLSQ